MSTNELIHPSTNPDGTCSDLSCPCQQWAKQENATRAGLDLYHHEEALRQRRDYSDEQERAAHNTDSEQCNTYRANAAGIPDPQDRCVKPKGHEGKHSLTDSPALRNTRSVIHHAEMVEDQKRRETCSECGHQNSVDPRGRCRETQRDPGGSMVYCGCKCVFPGTTQGQTATAMTPATDFDHAWNELPESDRRVTERAVAEKLYYAGRRDRETEMLRDVNETLRGVAERIAGERLR